MSEKAHPKSEYRQLIVGKEVFHEVHYHELSDGGQFKGLLEFQMDAGEIDLHGLSEMLALNNIVEGNVFGSHLILKQVEPEKVRIVALVSIFPAGVTSICGEVETTYGFTSAGVVLIESKEDDVTARRACVRAGYGHAVQCLQRSVNEKGAPQSWIAILNSNSPSQSILEAEGWILRGQRFFSGVKGRRIYSVWSITLTPALLPMVIEGFDGVSAIN